MRRLFAIAKTSDDLSGVIIVVVNLDYSQTQAGYVSLDLESLGLDADHPFRVYDLLAEAEYTWQGVRNYVELTPGVRPAHVLRVRK